MKKIVSVILVFVMMLTLAGCNIKNKDDGKIQIVTTLFPFYDFAKQVAGDKADVTLLLPTGSEAHSYEPTAKDVVKIKECDVFICQGMGSDPWINGIVGESSFDQSKIIFAVECADVYDTGHSHENVYFQDGHVWTSLKNSQKIVKCIEDVLSEKDPENADFYKANAENYMKELASLDKEFEELLADKESTLVFADRFPFFYFAMDYGLKTEAAYPGCSTESEPSAAKVASVIELIKKENIKIVFVTETSNGKLADTICEETGAEKRLLHSCHTVSKKDFQSGITYLELMKQNYNTLKEL